MALYEAVCLKCARPVVYRAAIEDRDKKAPPCQHCGGKTVRKISPPMVTVIGPAAG